MQSTVEEVPYGESRAASIPRALGEAEGSVPKDLFTTFGNNLRVKKMRVTKAVYRSSLPGLNRIPSEARR